MSYLAKNNAYSTLAAGISSGALSITVQSGHGDRFPVISGADYTLITFEDSGGNREVVKVTARSAASDVMTIVRAQEGTTARAWNIGDVVELRMTAQLVQDAMGHPAQSSAAHAASSIANTPAGNVAATTVQAAINELDSEKQAALGYTPANDVLGNLSNKATARANLGVEAAEVDVASAATTDIGAEASQNVRITGTTTITSLGTVAAGTVRKVRLAGALTLTHNATSLVLPAAGANIAAAAGDSFEAISLGAGNWFIRDYQKADGTSVVAAASEITGTVKDYIGTSAPAGYVLASGRTIGDASSGATERANADTATLFALIWDSMANTEAAVSGGRGASAAADFAAHKTIALPDARGRVIAGKDNMGGTAASRLTVGVSGITSTTLGASGGAEGVTLTAAQSGLPLHNHSGGAAAATPSYGYAESGVAVQAQQSTGSAGPSSASSAHSSTQPTLVLNKIIKL